MAQRSTIYQQGQGLAGFVELLGDSDVTVFKKFP